MADENGRKLNLNSKVVFSGSNIKNARAGKDQMNMPLVNLTLDAIGGNKMSKFSKQNVGNTMVTVFSEFYRNAQDKMVKKSKIINVATIQQHLGSKFSITNMSSPQAAQELSLLLRAGSLTAPVTIVKQRTIEATLGINNINNGIKALSVGIGITLLFMVFWYRSLGVIANVALTLNLISLLGLMSLLPGAVLTLPGIAGLVLTVGMAVDTNVLIFERIKEELKRGHKALQAIEQGYKSAFSTILDANITTMITGIILYTIGNGPVKGFALILCLGILTSMFTGVFVSKGLTNIVIRKNKTQLLGVNA
jgi:preprotein translocase subunit SecD